MRPNIELNHLMAKRKQPEPIVGELPPVAVVDIQVPHSEVAATIAQEASLVSSNAIGEATSEVEFVFGEPADSEVEEGEEDKFWSLLARAGYLVW